MLALRDAREHYSRFPMVTPRKSFSTRGLRTRFMGFRIGKSGNLINRCLVIHRLGCVQGVTSDCFSGGCGDVLCNTLIRYDMRGIILTKSGLQLRRNLNGGWGQSPPAST